MKTLLAAVGILFVLGGLITYPTLLTYSERTLKTSNIKVDRKWNIAWNFSEGENMSLSFRADNDWSILSGLEEITVLNGTEFPYVKTFQINVTNPLGNFTEVDVYLIITQPNGGVTYTNVFPDYFGLINNNGILVEKGYPKAAMIGGDNVIALGRAQHNGTYILNCTLDPPLVQDYELVNDTQRLWIHNVTAPVELWLYKQNEEIRYPYKSPLLLPVSSSVIAIGGITIIAGVVIKKGTRHKAMKV